MERILVTGGSGFIGSHLVEKLLEMGHQVTNYDKVPSPLNPGARHVVGDIGDMDLLQRCVPGHTIVCNLAAMVGVVDCIRNEDAVIRDNFDGVKNMLEACRKHGVARIVHASSSEVYGEGAGRDRLRETDPLTPLSIYGKTKAWSEDLLRDYSREEQAQATALRYCNVYGPRQRPDFVVPIFIRRALQGQPLLLCNGGHQIRSYTYIDDAVEGTIAAMFRKQTDYRVYNICSEFSLSVGQVARMVLELHGQGTSQAISYEEAGRRADYEIEHRIPSGQKASDELHFTAHTHPQAGFSQTYASYKEVSQQR